MVFNSLSSVLLNRTIWERHLWPQYKGTKVQTQQAVRFKLATGNLNIQPLSFATLAVTTMAVNMNKSMQWNVGSQLNSHAGNLLAKGSC